MERFAWRTGPHPASLTLGFPSPINGRVVVNAVNRGEGQSRSDFLIRLSIDLPAQES